MSKSSDLRRYASRIRDQADCGSCTAFGIIGAWEGLLRIKGGDPTVEIDLSEQDLFNCSGGTCAAGNTMRRTLNAAVEHGTCTEECNPYVGRDRKCGEGRCENYEECSYRLKDWVPVSDKEAIVEMLKTQPLVCTMAVHQSFMNYAGGVYHRLGEWDPFLGRHCMCVFGYVEEEDAFIVKNSWGTGWGEEYGGERGWARVRADQVDETMYRLVVDGYTPPHPPSPSPKPSKCWLGNGTAKMLNLVPWMLRRKGRFYYRNPPEK